MKADFKQHIEEEFLFLKKKKIILAVSGGLDSVVLCHLINSLGFSYAIAHCNFKLRPKDSDRDEVFVNDLALQLKVPFYLKKFTTDDFLEDKKLSVQMAARKLRYQWFKKLLIKQQYDYVMTAHHADDNLETFLINLSRGTGLEGLTGIPKKNNNTLRPLLPFSKEQIEQYAKKNDIKWREDLSNKEQKYLRNKIRHTLVPILKELNPNFLKAFTKTLDNLQMSKEIIDESIKVLSDKIIQHDKRGLLLDISELEKLANTRAYLFEFLKHYGFTQYDDIFNLLKAQSGKQVFSSSHRLIKDRDWLILTELETKNNELIYTFDLNDKELKTPDFSLKMSVEQQNKIRPENSDEVLIDLDKIKFPLLVRKWKRGDYFYPLGMTGKKKLSKFFKDEKLSLPEKEKIWLLCAGEEIVWVVGKRLDNRYKITEKTRQTLKITLQ